MSRRKQAKPRALKREDEHDEEEGEVAMATEEEEEETGQKDTAADITQLMSDTAGEQDAEGETLMLEGESGGQAATSLRLPEGEVVSMETGGERTEGEEYRCETCSAVFPSLSLFMDHCNYQCVADISAPWRRVGESPHSQTSSPYSTEDGHYLGCLDESPCSPSTLSVDLDALPCHVGASESFPYACQFCDRAYNKLSYLKAHEQIHGELMPYKCDFCSRSFKHKRSRDRHVKLHTGDRKYKCPQCDSAFSRSDHLKIHMKTHEANKPYQCTICNRGFTSPATLTSHVVTVHKPHGDSIAVNGLDPNGAGQEFGCVQCVEKFATLEELQEHVLLHDGGGVEDEKDVKDCRMYLLPPDERPFQCPICAELFGTEDAYQFHREEVHGEGKSVTCPVCSVKICGTEQLFCHLKKHELEKSAGLTSWETMTKGHGMKLVKKSTKNICPECKKSFSTIHALETHVKTMHMGIKDHLFSCYYCHLAFSSTSRLSEHIKLEHANLSRLTQVELKYPCDICPVEFNNAESLKFHKDNVHKFGTLRQSPSAAASSSPSSGEVSIYCSQCTKGFSNIYSLAEHMHNSHGYNNNNNNSPHTNNTNNTASTNNTPNNNNNSSSNNSIITNSTSAQSTPTKTHPKLVSPISSSLQPSDLDAVLRASQKSPGATSTISAMVMGTESYTCDHCNATFLDFKSYQAHVKNHVDSSYMKYSCSHCQAVFTNEDQLDNHVFVHYLALTTEYGCTSCLKLFSKPDELQKHLMDIHAHHLYRCSLCKEIFDSKVNVQVHFAIKHSNECKLYKCTNCASVFRSEMEWQLHVKVHHLGMSKPYRCLFCKESFSSENELQNHLATHKKQFRCSVCDEAFHVEYLLDKHVQTKHSSEAQSHKNKTNDAVTDVKPFSSPEKAPTPKPNMVVSKVSVKSPLNLSTSSAPSPVSKQASPVVATPPSLTLKKGELNYKCEICDVKFCDEETLQKHRLHDHSISPEMNLIMQKTQKTKSLALAAASPKAGTGSDKFSQLCVYCNQTFKTKSELEKHMKTHVTPSNQKCNICDEIFPSASILAEHKLTHCKVIKGNVCVVCKVAMKSEEQFYSHSQQHGFQGTNMQCVVCRQTLASMLELQMHARHHFQNPANFYTCCVCLKTCDSKENLISKLNSSGRSYYVCKPCYHGETPTIHQCATCGLKFESQVQLDAHSVQHKKTYQCIKCQESFATEYEIQLHVATHVLQEGNIHHCKICKRSFESPAKLQCHLIEHTFEGGDYKCYVCGAHFPDSSTIQMHVLEHGIATRRYACNQCPQKFFFSAELQNHLYVHTPSVTGSLSPGVELQCSDCPKVFTTSIGLNNHRRSHEKKDSHVRCSLCLESFETTTELHQHIYCTHATTDALKVTLTNHKQDVYSCGVCKQTFLGVKALQTHMRSHSKVTESPADPYPCPLCGRMFDALRSLTKHLHTHSGEKPYECPICHKRFTRKENRKVHMKSHAGVKPHTCPICTKSFSRRYHMKEHMKVHLNQVGTFICEVCDEKFTQGKLLRCHLLMTHHKSPDLLCVICHSSVSNSKDMKSHLLQTHGITDDLMDTISVGSNDSQLTDGDAEEDASDSLSVTSDGTLPNGREAVEDDFSMAVDLGDGGRQEQNVAQNNSVLKVEGNVAIVANPLEQLPVS